MPIYTNDPGAAPLNNPSDEFQIVRYMDLAKFISILYKKSIFFCRIDKMEDRFEGKIPSPIEKLSLENRQEFLRRALTPGSNEHGIKQTYELLQKVADNYSSLLCVNCWNIYKGESAALWKIYSDFSKGIMIKSSVKSLKESFKNTPENIYISLIEYANFRLLDFKIENVYMPFIRKQMAYKYEEEIRLIHTVSTDTNHIHDWSLEEVIEGVYLKTDLDELIEEIIIAPSSPEWFLNLLQDLLNKYGLKKNIKRSELTYPVS